jgi:putative DNA-invertase from lambdoid prophage Rac
LTTKNTIRAYLRCSTDKQDERAQRARIAAAGFTGDLEPVHWLRDTQSGGMAWQQRGLAIMLSDSVCGDTIVVSEVSRIARSMTGVLTFLEAAAAKGVLIECCEPRLTLDASIGGKVMAFAFGLAAEIERHMLRQRTRAGLAARRAAGVTLGRPVGSTGKSKLDEQATKIDEMIGARLSVSAIARMLGCSRQTVAAWLARNRPGAAAARPLAE